MDWLEQALASAVRYVQNRADNDASLYFDEIPEDYMVPSIYFPVPMTDCRRVSFDTFLTTLQFEAWFMASTDWLAYADAARVRDCLMMDKCKIDIMQKDGQLTGKALYTTEPTTSKVESGIVRLTFGIRNYVSKENEHGSKAVNYKFNGLVKPDALYEAWIGATEEQRKEEEDEKECLKKALESL